MGWFQEQVKVSRGIVRCPWIENEETLWKKKPSEDKLY